MNVEAKRFLNKIDYLEKKLIGEDKKIFVKAMLLFDECARLLNEKELQVKKQKEVINKAINWIIKYQTEWCQEDEVIRDLKQLLDILKGVSE